MAKWNFFVSNTSLIKELDTSGNDVNPQSQSFLAPTLDLQGSKIVFKDNGSYKTALLFTEIGTIDGDIPTDLQDAYDKIIALIPNSGGGGGSVGTLQEVTDNGNTIVSGDFQANFEASAIEVTNQLTGTGTSIDATEGVVIKTGSFQGKIKTDNLTAVRTNQLPDTSGTIALTSDIPTVDATPTDGSSNAVSSNGVFDGLALKQDFATATTGAVISFSVPQVYNSFSSPTASNITDSLGTAKIGIVQKIYSNKATEPTYPAGWVKLSGTYTNSVTNIIYCEWCEGSRVEYWIVKA